MTLTSLSDDIPQIIKEKACLEHEDEKRRKGNSLFAETMYTTFLNYSMRQFSTHCNTWTRGWTLIPGEVAMVAELSWLKEMTGSKDDPKQDTNSSDNNVGYS